MSNYKKVYPTKDDLSKIKNKIKCTESNCKSVFTSESNLSLHLQKTHKKGAIKKYDGDLLFFCPVEKCVYYTSKHFKSKKLLKQHYLKVHASKEYICETCNKGFSTESFKNSHKSYCKVTFTCNDCDSAYSSYETLKTHSRRKNHSIKDKSCFEINENVISNKHSFTNNDNEFSILIQPKNTIKIIVLPLATNGTETNVVQSDISNKNDTQVFLKKNQYTQTGYKYPQITIGTQTQNNDNDITLTKKSNALKMQSGVQTNISVSYNNDNCQLNENCDHHLKKFKKDDMEDTRKERLNDLDSFENTFLNCNMETQTDAFEDLLNYCDFYSNTCTQTCNNLLLNSLELNNKIGRAHV